MTSATFDVNGVTYVARDLDGHAAAAYWAAGTPSQRARRRGRRALTRGLALLVLATVGSVAISWAVAISGAPQALLAAALALEVAGLVSLLITLDHARPAGDAQPDIIAVPNELHGCLQRQAVDRRQLWRCSVAIATEARLRETISWERSIDRGADAARARRALTHYAAAYRAYEAACIESGVPVRLPAVPLPA